MRFVRFVTIKIYTFASLNCYNNKLTSLPKLQKSYLKELDCSYNNLIYLPELPTTLKKLSCKNNINLVIPELPASLKILSCDNSNIFKSYKKYDKDIVITTNTCLIL